MPRATCNGVELEYEVVGDGEPMVLIMGIGAQLVMWPDELVDQLAGRGYRVVRFDHRDVGLSQKLDHLGKPDVRRSIVRGLLGLPVDAPYTLSDMADDVAGLMDHLGIDSAHVVGASMGGMIAQTMAIVQPSRLRSLTSIMSAPGDRFTGIGTPRAIRALLGKPPRSAEESVAAARAFYAVCGSRGYPLDEEGLSLRARRAFERGFHPPGFARHMAAILATGDRSAALRFVRAPSLVLHGTDDPLIRPVAGRRTARCIPNARLKMIPGMGHDLPRGAWPVIVDAIAQHCRATGRARAAAPRATVTPIAAAASRT